MNPFRKLAYSGIEFFINIKVKLLQSKIRSKPLQYGLNKEKRAKRIVVSLTSYPARFPTLDITIRSLLNQTMRPDKIVLFLHKDGEYDKVTPNIKALEEFGLEIVPCDVNLRPHNKYFHAMQKYPDDIIITVDDDQYYNERLIENLFESYKRYPGAVSAVRTREIQFDKNGEPLTYKKWRRAKRKRLGPLNSIFALGVGGVLYPPGCMDRNILLDADKIKEICLRNDDVWLKAVQLKKGTKVVVIPRYKKFRLNPVGTQKIALHKSNIGENENDIIVKNIISEFKLTAGDFKN